MKNRLYSSFSLLEKNLVKMTLEEFQPRPEQLRAKVTSQVGDHQQLSSATPDDQLKFTIDMAVQVFDLTDPRVVENGDADGLECFKVYASFIVLMSVIEPIESDKPLPETYGNEIFAFAYDDLRIVIEDAISRTSYKGFYLPVDFRQIQGSPAEE